jgi:hypothetical protein
MKFSVPSVCPSSHIYLLLSVVSLNHRWQYLQTFEICGNISVRPNKGIHYFCSCVVNLLVAINSNNI